MRTFLFEGELLRLSENIFINTAFVDSSMHDMGRARLTLVQQFFYLFVFLQKRFRFLFPFAVFAIAFLICLQYDGNDSTR